MLSGVPHCPLASGLLPLVPVISLRVIVSAVEPIGRDIRTTLPFRLGIHSASGNT